MIIFLSLLSSKSTLDVIFSSYSLGSCHALRTPPFIMTFNWFLTSFQSIVLKNFDRLCLCFVYLLLLTSETKARNRRGSFARNWVGIIGSFGYILGVLIYYTVHIEGDFCMFIWYACKQQSWLKKSKCASSTVDISCNTCILCICSEQASKTHYFLKDFYVA